MYNLFAFAIGARLVAFIVFVACVYAGNLLFAKLERRQTKFLWKMTFVTLESTEKVIKLMAFFVILEMR